MWYIFLELGFRKLLAIFLYQLPNYSSKQQIRDDCKWGGVSIYIRNSSSYKIILDLCINSVDIDSFSVEILLINASNTPVKILYRPPTTKIKPFEVFLDKINFYAQDSNKNLDTAENFNRNLLDHRLSKKIDMTFRILFIGMAWQQPKINLNESQKTATIYL